MPSTEQLGRMLSSAFSLLVGTAVVGLPALAFGRLAWTGDLPAELYGPVTLGALFALGLVAILVSNARDRHRYARDPDAPSPSRAPTISWTPYVIVALVLLPAQALLNAYWLHAGDLAAAIALVTAFTLPALLR